MARLTVPDILEGGIKGSQKWGIRCEGFFSWSFGKVKMVAFQDFYSLFLGSEDLQPMIEG